MAISTDETGEVKFKRSTTEGINALPIESGSLIYNTENGKTYMDYNNKRIQTGGNADTMIAISEIAPTDEDIIIWINNDPLNYYSEFKYRNRGSSHWEDLTLPPIGDTVPIGAVIEYSGSTIPYGWESAGTGKIRKVKSLIGSVGVVSDSYSTNSEVVYNAPYINAQNGKILWRNPNPTSSFAAQKITLNSSDYDVLELIVAGSTSRPTGFIFEKTLKGQHFVTAIPVDINEGVAQSTGTRARSIHYVDDLHYDVGNGLTRSNSEGSAVPTINNNLLIPLYIVGYKTNIFN